MGMSSGFDDEVRRAVNRQKAEDDARRLAHAEKERNRIAQEQKKEREREELRVFRDGVLKEFQSDIARTIEYLVTLGVQPSRITVFPEKSSSARAETPKPPTKGMFRRKPVRPPEPPPSELHGWPMGISSMGDTTIWMAYEQTGGAKYHPDQTDEGGGHYVDVGWREEYFLSRDRDIHLLYTDNSEGRWYLRETVSMPWVEPWIIPLFGEPPIKGTEVISKWQNEWRTKLARFIANKKRSAQPAP